MDTDRIVYAGVATTEGIIIFHSEMVELNPVIESLIGGIDFYVDHKRSFGSHVRTKGNTIQYIVDNEIAFISAASHNFPQRICFKFLTSLADEFRETALNSENDKLQFENWIKRQMQFFSEDSSVDSLRNLKRQVDDISSVMHSNIEMTLGRGAQLEGILTESQRLQSKTSSFDKLSKDVKCAMLQDNVRSTLNLVIVIMLILLCLVGIIGAVVYILFY